MTSIARISDGRVALDEAVWVLHELCCGEHDNLKRCLNHNREGDRHQEGRSEERDIRSVARQHIVRFGPRHENGERENDAYVDVQILVVTQISS